MLVSLEILDDVKEELESSTEDVTSVLKEGNPELVQATSPLRPWRQAARAGEEPLDKLTGLNTKLCSEHLMTEVRNSYKYFFEDLIEIEKNVCFRRVEFKKLKKERK